ncbi:PREDICTED: gamma-aminobutyric acid type B receptor subunit 1-like isoform X1 [Amphimedon queenslandica]|uniref:G-protein coupled receptors family 3 profile domain-containing protein n=2 Tax=Amphimedon queenslandica TaxID=400682 RepID=A0AAN0JFT9_AMPQE|nr:PREDICTED: gamma-aminobutyric acid type B receptor subunit 1-like isoform X1 [Amphimedon queenslandica]|eukprot:XP_019855508.1 PREDICTED: gamma-aminobutyric acid type B receptor subunit 1-like isoform X1 [Amphimedon queenslandica]
MFRQQLLLLLLFFNVARTQSSYLNCSIATGYPLRFVGFFPCLNQWDEVGDCDRLTLTAVERAIAEINQDTNILRCFKIEMLPITVKNPAQNPTELIEFLYKKHNNLPIHGVIGPYHPESAKMFAYIFGHYLSTLQISYSVTSVLDANERYPYFHTTIPNDEYYSVVTGKLLDRFNWQKVAIISTFDEESVLASQSIFKRLKLDKKRVHYFDSFINSAESIFNLTKEDDFTIFLAIMDPRTARNLLCQAYHAGLTTDKYAWILRGMTNPNWWRVGDVNGTDCTNNEMKEALESALFVDMQSSTLPKMNYEERSIILGILNSNGSLTEAEFYSLLHSKVFNAYDAARILALTWNVTINNYTTEELHNLLNQSWKISNEERLSLVETLQYNLFNVVSPYTGLAGSYHFDKNRGKVESAIVTQFTGGKECIIGYYDSTNSTNLQECDTEFCCNVTWKGGNQPMDGLCPNGSCTCRQPFDSSIMTSYISITVLLSIGVVISMLLQIYNYRLRNNKYFKGSSPILNAIITFGCTMGYANGYLFLVNNYIGMTGNGKLKTICNITMSSFWLSQLLINSTILVKNWRIFRIFHNPLQKNRNNLSNTKLVVGIGLISAPFIVLLILIQLIRPLEVRQASFKTHCPGYPNNTETSLIEDHCIELLQFGWDVLIFSYMVFLLIIIIILGSFNCRIKGHFNKEGELAILAGAMTLLLYPLYVGVAVALQWSDAGDIEFVMSQYQMFCTVTFILAYNSFFLAVLYGSKAILLCRDKKVKSVKRKSTLRKKFSDLHDEIFELTGQLKKMNDSSGTFNPFEAK